MVEWTKDRVRNFSESFARPYVHVLVALDGQLYRQDQFFKALADTGVVQDVPQTGTAEEISELRAKRWDSYLGKIREFGLGFTLEERRKGGPAISVWRVSPIAKDFDSGHISYREFMALQCMRTQLPRPAMPLQAQQRAEINRGVLVRPLALIIEALDAFEASNIAVYLSRDEIFGQLAQVEQHNQLSHALTAIQHARASGVNPKAAAQQTASADIWLNEFECTGYLRQLRPSQGSGLPPHIIVRNMSRWGEARLLRKAVPVQNYSDDLSTIDAFFTFFSSSPTEAELAILRREPDVVQFNVPGEAQFQAGDRTLTGSFDTIGGLMVTSPVLLTGPALDQTVRATIYEVTEPASDPVATTATVRLRSLSVRADLQPIVTS